MSEAIEACDVVKSFGHVKALRGVSVTARHGEIVALLGDNGAGKSTLVKVLSGVHQPDTGELRLGGERVSFASSHAAQEHGVEVVYQDLALAADLTVTQNIFLGRELPRRGRSRYLGLLDESRMRSEAVQVLDRLAIRGIPERALVGDLSGGQRQAVAIGRALLRARNALLMDEPTAALGTRQSDLVCDAIRHAADSGLAVIVVSHDLERMLRLVDRVVVLHRGRVAMDQRAEGLRIPTIVGAMMGERADEQSA